MTTKNFVTAKRLQDVKFEGATIEWEKRDNIVGGNPGYRAMIEWGRGRCFPSYQALKSAYAAAQDNGVK